MFFLCSGRVVRYGSNTKEYSITKDGQKNDRDASQYSCCISIKQGKKKPGPKPCSQDEQKLNTKKLNNQRLACAVENLIFVHLCITKIMRMVKEIMKPVVNIGSNQTVLEVLTS